MLGSHCDRNIVLSGLTPSLHPSQGGHAWRQSMRSPVGHCVTGGEKGEEYTTPDIDRLYPFSAANSGTFAQNRQRRDAGFPASIHFFCPLCPDPADKADFDISGTVTPLRLQRLSVFFAGQLAASAKLRGAPRGRSPSRAGPRFAMMNWTEPAGRPVPPLCRLLLILVVADFFELRIDNSTSCRRTRACSSPRRQPDPPAPSRASCAISRFTELHRNASQRLDLGDDLLAVLAFHARPAAP